jgi:phosphatidylinositol 4-kinase type 2
MFGRQIAVMKGQAWNVVETLKTPDHGPLELTRRARVYVWDDLVDIPVAVPMRVPSGETRRKHVDLRTGIEEEEMDISAANASAPPLQHDLLGLHSPPSELPHPGRFDLSRTASTTDITQTTDPLQRSVSSIQSERPDQDRGGSRPPRPKRSRTRLSLDGPMQSIKHSNSHKRRFSLSHRTSNGALLYDGDDLEGDLGYSAAEGLEKHQRKVIVERLETVKGRNPVFTWC